MQTASALSTKYETLQQVDVHTCIRDFCFRLELACVTKRKQSTIQIFSLWKLSSDLASKSGKSEASLSNNKSSLSWKLKKFLLWLYLPNCKFVRFYNVLLNLDNPVSHSSDKVTDVDISGKIFSLTWRSLPTYDNMMSNKKGREHQSLPSQASEEKRPVWAKSWHASRHYLYQIAKCFKAFLLDSQSVKNY